MKAKDLLLTPRDDARAEAVRVGEKPKLWFRAGRTFKLNGSWYFTTREGIDVGPYQTQFDADLEANMLAQKLKQTPTEMVNQVIRCHALEADIAAGTMHSAAFTDYVVSTSEEELAAALSHELSR